jgi:hypothetical protein
MPEPKTAVRRKLEAQEVFALAHGALQKGRLKEAETLYRTILKSVASSDAARNLGILLDDQGRHDEAEAVYRRHLEASPDDPVIRLQLAFLLLRGARLAEAWPYYEARFQRPGANPKPQFDLPEWRGQRVGSLLIWPEQGIGDQIQFARFGRALATIGIDVTLVCDPALERLFARLGPTIVPARGALDLPRPDAWVMAGSIPLKLGTTFEDLPRKPYLPADPGSFGIGLVSTGNARNPGNAGRSLPPELAAEMLTWPGVSSLEPEATGASDLRDTADLIDGMELVITVDTAVAHLAGAMGKPTWLMLPHKADWRWLRDRADSPWYPSMRLFRQPAPGDWASVVEDVRQALIERDP